MHGRIGLFTEEGFPVCVKLDELSAEDIRFVVNKLGQPLRSKVEAQLSAKQTITHVEYSNADSDNRMAQELSTSTTEQESTKEGQDIPDLDVRDGREVYDGDWERERRGCE